MSLCACVCKRERERERERASERAYKINKRTTIIVISIILFTNPSARAGYDTRSVFKRSLTGLNSEFSFSKTSCLTKAEEPSLLYYFPIAGGRMIGFIPFPRVLVLCENAIILVQDLNSCRRVHFRRR